ncbi:MAG: DNA polymerase III subunit delta [Desulfohalobiaceae bacterium]
MSRPGFTLCVCPDPALIRRYIAGQLESSADGPWKRHVFWADQDPGPEFWDALTLSGLFEGSKAVVLRRAESGTAELWNQLSPVLCRHNPRSWLFICLESPWSRGKPKIPATLSRHKYYTLAEKRQWIWSSPGLTRNTLRSTVTSWAKEHGLEFAPGVLDMACQILPLDMSALETELGKLSLLLKRGEKVTSGHLSVVSFQPDLDIFGFLNALQSSRGQIEAWRKVLSSQAGASSDLVFPFLGLMVREARILWQLAMGEDQAVRLPPRVKRDKAALASRLGPRRLAAIWTLALETEAGIKSGRRAPDQAMEAFVSGLMRLFATPG